MLYGGTSKAGGGAAESVGRDAALLHVESGTWERPGLGRTLLPLHSHSAVVVGRTKLLVFGGVRGDGSTSSDVALLNTDTMKWMTPQLKVGMWVRARATVGLVGKGQTEVLG